MQIYHDPVTDVCVYIVILHLLSAFSDKSAAEKRRQLIQESKFLGGDMEHTHLVKGLDFALLQKVSGQSRKIISPSAGVWRI